MTTAAQTIKAGTRIETFGCGGMGGFPAVAPEGATVLRWTKVNGPIKNHVNPTNGGWHVIRFDDGKVPLLMHETGFRVVSNRA